jgi:LysM repeat protein/lipoprotein-anchoring transpeptidase ErfK/SrfK
MPLVTSVEWRCLNSVGNVAAFRRVAKRIRLRAMFLVARCAFISTLAAFLAGDVAAQPAAAKGTTSPRVEPGLENAVEWKWRAVPSDPKDWGLELPDLTHLAQVTPTPTSASTEGQFTLYEVQRGDALFLIGKRFGVTVDQIKQANGLSSDLIRAGETLKIPPPSPAAQRPPASADVSPPKSRPTKTPRQESEAELNHVRLQVFLDREQFSSGPITGKPTAAFGKVKFLYQSHHPDAKDDAALVEKAKATVSEVFAEYELKREDFRFIAPPRAETAVFGRTKRSRAAPGSARPAGSPLLNKPSQAFEQLIASPMLAYRSPWEFVAERFHCSEAYLRALNSNLPGVPGTGAKFRVPNIVPFEIEKALEEPLQPQVDPENPITAAIEGLSQLNIYRKGTLIAVFPLSIARPSLRGRGTWTILGALARPRLATRQEAWREVAKRPAPLFGSSTPTPTPAASKPKLASEQFLPAGPRNPAGIIWIDLAKSDSPDPLPYGLHGTSIPDQMNALESIGGLRMINWDIARAVRLLPSGTPLEWRQ